MSLKDGILVIQAHVGLQPFSADTSLWPALQLDERSGRPGAFLARGVSPGSIGCLKPLSLFFHIANVISLHIPREIDIPLLGSVARGE